MSAAQTDERKLAWGISVLLVAGVFAVFGQTSWFGFVNYDDDWYVYNNPQVLNGLTREGLEWAVTYGQVGNWHPLTWISLMLDGQVYGTWAGGYHLTNVGLQAAAAVLLFLALRRMTGALWRSAFVAAVFAVHPLRAESVAWVAERKDVLSGVFFMLTLLAYARYARRPTAGRSIAVSLWLGAGLLCKNMLVTVPVVLLLLDYWPLGRAGTAEEKAGGREKIGERAGSLVLEKLPWILLAAGTSAVTMQAARNAGVAPAWRLRWENAAVAPVIYLRELFWPANLILPHPSPTQSWPMLEVLGALMVLTGITVAVWGWRRRCPYLMVGWFWYLGMLGPVLGIIPTTMASADRYTYLPQIGVVMALAWEAAELAGRWRVQSWVAAVAASGLVVALGAQAWRQTGYWRNSETLWRHALACGPDNIIANYNLAHYLTDEGRGSEAAGYLRAALAADPNYADANVNLGNLLLGQGQAAAALACFQRALAADPGQAKTHNDLGNALLAVGRTKDAGGEFRQALEIDPDYPKACYNLGNALSDQGQMAAAAAEYARALELEPDLAPAAYNLGNAQMALGRLEEAVGSYRRVLQLGVRHAEVYNNLGSALMNLGQAEEAAGEFRHALQLDPKNAQGLDNLAWILATSQEAATRHGAEAVTLAEQARGLTDGKDPLSWRALAAADAETGQFAAAQDAARQALQLATAAGDSELVESVLVELGTYEKNQPYRTEAKPAATETKP